MTRLFVVCEGQTEERFVKDLLQPHLLEFKVYAQPTIVITKRAGSSGGVSKGGGRWKHWKRDLRNLLQSPAPDLCVTTLMDLYGLPSDFPEYGKHQAVADTEKRCELFESELSKEFNSARFLPYIQRHEFEALVLASLPALRCRLTSDEDRAGHDQLSKEVAGCAPEEINDGRNTAPSKRLKAHMASYSKTVDGPSALKETGLRHLRSECPRFGAWVEQLEGLAKSN